MLNVDNLKIICINKKETNVKLECANFSRIFVIKKNIILIFNDHILINDDKIKVVVNHITKYKNTLLFSDQENIYKLCFEKCEIIRFYVGNLRKGEMVEAFLGVLTKDGLYRLFSDHKSVYELSDVKDFKMKYYVLKSDGKWYNKDEKLEDVYTIINIEFGSLLIQEDKMILNSNSIDNELFHGDLGSDDNDNPVFYACSFDDYILVVSSKYSSVCLYSKDLRHIDQSGNPDYLFVKADEKDEPIYLRGIDSSEDQIVTVDKNGTVTSYKVEGIEDKEREIIRFTSVTSYKIVDKEFILCNDNNKEIEDIFHCVMENEDSILTDNSFTVHDKTKNIKMDVGDIGYDSLSNFDKGNSDELSDTSSPSISSPNQSKDASKISNEDSRKEKDKSLEEPSLDISNLFAPLPSNASNVSSTTKETKIQKPTISLSRGFLDKNSNNSQETFLNLTKMNISNKSNAVSSSGIKHDKDESNKDNHFSEKISHVDLKGVTFGDKNLSGLESDKSKPVTKKETNTTLRSKSYTNLSTDKGTIDHAVISKDNIKNKLKDISKDLEHNVDDIINQINSIKVNNDSINCYKLNTSKIPKLYDELYQNIMRLENVNNIKQNIESNLITMINNLDLQSNFDETKVKNSINYFNEVIERNEVGNIVRPMCYDEPIVDDFELGISSLKIYNKIEEKKDNSVLSKIYLEPLCSLGKNTGIDASSISFISLENESKCKGAESKEKNKINSRIQEKIPDLKFNVGLKNKDITSINDDLKDATSSVTTYSRPINTNVESSIVTQFNNTNASVQDTGHETTSFIQNPPHNTLPSVQSNIFGKINVTQNDTSNNTPVMSGPIQGSNIFNGGVANQKDLNQSSSEVFSRIVNSGASIPVIKKSEPQDESKPPSAFSKFASNHTLFK